MKIYDVVILGGGASGLMCGAHLNKNLNVAIVDVNNSFAKKLQISGGGKCNFTNANLSTMNFDGDEKLIKNAIEIFSRDNLLAFMKENNISTVLRKRKYWFCEKSSNDLINILLKKTQWIKKILNTKIKEVQKKDGIFEVFTDTCTLKSKKLILATGGKSFSNLGASGIGLEITKSFNLKIKKFTPALVGMTVQKEQFWMKKLSGLSCYVHIKTEGKILKEEMLFTHKGISGPCILSVSLYWEKGNISINFLPNENIVTLMKNSKKLISTIIPLPKRLSKAILKAIDVQDIECRKINKQILERLKNIHNYTFAPAGNFGFSRAEVSKGGILSECINTKTLELLEVKNMYVIGEIVDVTGELGGYNFQWAFSSAIVCSNAICAEGYF